jgi:hypothetical protein
MIAANAAASTVPRVIKDRPHRLDLMYVNQPLYFVTFVTRDRRAIPCLDDAQLALQRKRSMSVALKSPQLWQPGFFDHILRSDESYAEKWNYVRDNPVRAGLVDRADD